MLEFSRNQKKSDDKKPKQKVKGRDSKYEQQFARTKANKRKNVFGSSHGKYETPEGMRSHQPGQ